MHEHLSSSVSHYFAKMLGAGQAMSTSEHVARGEDCVRPSDVAGSRFILPEVRRKVAPLGASSRLRQRVEILALFLEEKPAANTTAQREAVFVLFYLLNGHDLIPDNIPEIGLLDDALLIEAAFNRNLLALRSHWATQGRPVADGFLTASGWLLLRQAPQAGHVPVPCRSPLETASPRPLETPGGFPIRSGL